MEKDKPPILGLIQRGGQVVLRMLANVQQATIKPVITAAVAPGTLVHTDEYAVYARRHRQVVCRLACEMRLSRVGGRDDDTCLPDLRRLPLPG